MSKNTVDYLFFPQLQFLTIEFSDKCRIMLGLHLITYVSKIKLLFIVIGLSFNNGKCSV